MSFWRTFGFHTVSAIESLLEKENFTLEELLDEEDLLSECKSQNQKLLDYLLNPDTLRNLMNYLTNDPPPNADPKVKGKYPYLACEILSLEVWDICEGIYEKPELLNKLWSFLDKEPPINPFSVRVATVLMQRKIGDSFNFLTGKEDVVKKFLVHIGNPSVNELLMKLIQCDETQEGAGIVKWLNEQNLIGLLVEKFDARFTADEHESVGQALVDIIASESHGCSSLLEELQTEAIFGNLFRSITSSSSRSAIFWGLQVAIEIVRRDSHANKDDPPPYIRVCRDYMKPLASIISDNSSGRFSTTIGEVVPVGTHRLKVVEFFAVLLMQNYSIFDALLLDLGVFEACIALFFRYHWNNFLHAAVSEMVCSFLGSRTAEQSLRLITECKLIDRICEANSENEKDISTPKGFSRGYMGFIDKMSNKLLEAAETDLTGSISAYLKSCPNWCEFVGTTLKKHNSDAAIILGGSKPSAEDPDPSSGDEDGPTSSGETSNAFSYPVKQGFTNDFPKDFLADDDDDCDDEEADDLGNLILDKNFDKLLGEPYRTEDSDEEEEDYVGN